MHSCYNTLSTLPNPRRRGVGTEGWLFKLTLVRVVVVADASTRRMAIFSERSASMVAWDAIVSSCASIASFCVAMVAACAAMVSACAVMVSPWAPISNACVWGEQKMYKSAVYETPNEGCETASTPRWHF